MITLVIALTWACPSGLEHKTEVTYNYPKQLQKAIDQYNRYEIAINRLDHSFGQEKCTLVDIKGGHRKGGKVEK
jgi:hypothetical protein